MPSSNDTIRFLRKNIEQLQGLGRLETILPILDAMKVSMTDMQFDMAMTNLTMSADNRKVAHRFLVLGKTTHELGEEGVSPSRLSKVLSRVFANFDVQLDALELVSGHYTLDLKTAKLVRELEASKISEAKLRASTPAKRTRKTKKKTKAKKTQ